MKYREFMTLTNAEIEFILNELYSPVKIIEIERDMEDRSYGCFVSTDSWVGEEGETVEIKEYIDLYENTIENNFSSFKEMVENNWKWKQYLFSLGCNKLLKDNPYLKNE